MAEPSCPGCQQRDAAIATLLQRVEQLEAAVKSLQGRLGRNSGNSSLPPSANPPDAPKPAPKRPSGRTPGGQPGHPGHRRQRLPAARVDHVIPLLPSHCERCHAALPPQPQPGDLEPTWHQVCELPRQAAVVTEFQSHARTCLCWRHFPREAISPAISADAFGPG